LIKKISQYNFYFNEGFWVAIGQTLSFIFNIIGIKIMTDKMFPAEYGKLSLFLTYVTLITQIFYAPICAGGTRFYVIAKEQGELQKFYKSILYFFIVFSFISASILIIFSIYLFCVQNNNYIYLLLLSFIFSILSGININIISILDAARKRKIVAIFQSSDTFLRYIISIFLISYISPNAQVVFFGYSFASLFILIMLFLTTKKKLHLSKIDLDKIWNKKIWNYIRPFMIWGIFTWIQLSSDKWALAFFKSTKEVGVYTALYQIGFVPISILVGFGVQLLTPILFEKVGDGNNKKSIISVDKMINKISIAIIIFMLFIFIIAYFFHRLIFSLIFRNPEFLIVSEFLPWLILSGGLFSISQAFTIKMLGKMRTSELAKIKISTSLIGILFNFSFAYFWGVFGVVIANLLFSLLFLASILLYNRKQLQNPVFLSN